VPGRHNVANALASLAVADLCGVAPEAAADALARFGGVRRRLELKGTVGGVAIYDDYAHHPTEIVATLRAARERHRARLWCVFQPHTVNRTRSLFKEFAAAFGDADRVLVADIYLPAGREVVVGEITSGDLVRAMGHPGAAHVGSLDEIVGTLAAEVRPGDLVLTMGAGDVYQVGEDLLERLRG
jgi:UDP-N-acetylmuramate--alanine ligase